jgi:hypothetical protein
MKKRCPEGMFEFSQPLTYDRFRHLEAASRFADRTRFRNSHKGCNTVDLQHRSASPET